MPPQEEREVTAILFAYGSQSVRQPLVRGWTDEQQAPVLEETVLHMTRAQGIDQLRFFGKSDDMPMGMAQVLALVKEQSDLL
jgi:hypothetical protein